MRSWEGKMGKATDIKSYGNYDWNGKCTQQWKAKGNSQQVWKDAVNIFSLAFHSVSLRVKIFKTFAFIVCMFNGFFCV